MVVFPTPAGPIVTIPYTMLALRRRAAGRLAAGAARRACSCRVAALPGGNAAAGAAEIHSLAAVTYVG